ncbi:MAG: hypothetical protein SPH68_06110 [Candidatus Borkfalkiaceae bacterium]|nr:hypothetical protein [Clostridia bacterium]MDY6223714.1 hypothetical protein [Christensenellaceae bacterium]
MKKIRRILAVVLLIIGILAVSYIAFTAKQIPKENGRTEAVYEEKTSP